jgi:PqqD family protein of HPr-rel-A system
MEANQASDTHSTPSPSIAQLWQPVDCFRLHWRVWDDQYVVYNDGSGHMHVLDPVAALIVQKIHESPCRTDELIQQIATLLGIEATEKVRETLIHTLWNLGELEIVEPVTA